LEELRNKTRLTPEEERERNELIEARRRRFGNRQMVELDRDLRRFLRQETELLFSHVFREDRSVVDLINPGYTFLNERLAKHYAISNISGAEMRRVELPPDSPRGGILAQGSVLIVTSNPTRTSPVKRGLFILENVLGVPPPPPPADIPLLEESEKAFSGREPTLREVLAVHRENALCSSCHNRMDPLGLAFENFNAMGMWRDQELGEPVDATGQLITGEQFNGVKELKRLLAEKYSLSFYRTITEKMLTYALGRGLDYYDVQTVDQIVAQLEKAGGRPSALLMGVVESAPFQKTRTRGGQAASQNDQLQSGANGLKVLAHRALNNETRP
jgi:hypothetical protein